MPINMSVEYPKLQNEVTELRYQREKLIEALETLLSFTDKKQVGYAKAKNILNYIKRNHV